MRRFDGAEVGASEAVEEAVDHLPVDPVGHVQRQAFAAEGGLDVGQQPRQRDALRVDLVDDDHAGEAARGCVFHHAHRHRLDAGGGIDDHRHRLDRLQRRQALAEEVGSAGRVDEVDARAGMREVHHRGVERMQHAALERVVVANGAAALDAAARADGARLVQQGLGQRGLAGDCGAHERQCSHGFHFGREAVRSAWHGWTPLHVRKAGPAARMGSGVACGRRGSVRD